MVQRTLKIEAPIDIVFDTVFRIEDYPSFLSSTKAVDVDRREDEMIVDFTVDVIKEVQYQLRFTWTAPESLEWEMTQGDLFKKNAGSWELRKVSDEVTEATYTVDVAFGWMVPKTVVSKLTESQLPELLESFRQRAISQFKQREASYG